MLKLYKPEHIFTEEEFEKVLNTDLVARLVKKKHNNLKQGDIVGVRLNLNITKVSPKHVFISIHKGEDNSRDKTKYLKNRSFFTGEIIDYSRAIFISNAFFNVNQLAREQVASGQVSNFPMASVDGTFEKKDIPEGFNGIHVKFNPMYQHLFVDEEGYAIKYAEEVVVLGHRAYACGKIVYHNNETAPKQMGITKSETKIKESDYEIFIPKSHKDAVKNRVLLA